MKRKQGFTLIEMLMVITIMFVLIALLVPAVKVAIKTARKVEAKANLMSVEVAWRSYFDDYSIWPDFNGGMGISVSENTVGVVMDKDIVSLLTGDDKRCNPKARSYIERPTRVDKDGNMVDIWDRKMMFMLDMNYDNTTVIQLHSEKITIPKRVAVWFTGKSSDGQDIEDIKSWE